MDNDSQNWWSRECGGREVLVLALPLFVSMGSWSIMLFVDRMFLLWYSPDAMAAALPAGMMYWTMVCFPVGIAGYVNTFVAQYHGAARYDRIGAATWQGIRIGLYAIPFFLAAIPLAPRVFALAGHPPSVLAGEIVYFQTLTLGATAAVVAAAQSSFFTGRGVARVVMVVDIVAVALNLILDYMWIFGHGGFPELGLVGAALATVISLWFKVAIFAWLMWREPVRLTYHLKATWRIDRPLLRRLFVYGFPNGLHMLVEGMGFTLLVMLVGRYGETALTATTIALNLNSIVFVPMLGIGIAAGTLVGQQITRGRPDLAARATWTSLAFAVLYTSTFAACCVLVPDMLMFGHAAGSDPDKFTEIRELTRVLLRFVAAYCSLDAMQVVFAGAIRGAGDTWFVFGVIGVTATLFVSICWWGASLGLLWWWSVVTAWISTLGVVFCLRFVHGPWREMRVIESEA